LPGRGCAFAAPWERPLPSSFIALILTEVRPEWVEKLAGTFAQAACARGCTITRADNRILLFELPKPESVLYVLPALSPGQLPSYNGSAVPVRRNLSQDKSDLLDPSLALGGTP
jgi:hypothetical protein